MGPDAYEFRPEQWFDMNDKFDSPVGVYGNLCVALPRAPCLCQVAGDGMSQKKSLAECEARWIVFRFIRFEFELIR